MSLVLVFVLITIGLALVFEYTNGFHDAANVVSTVIATKVLPPLVAIIMASILNMIGATQISKITTTLMKGIVPVSASNQTLIIAALIGAILWNIFTWLLKIPSSSTYALVGGLIGAGVSAIGWNAILWTSILRKIILPMVVSPFFGFSLAFILMSIIGYQTKNLPQKVKIFSKLQVVSAAFVALSHGLNDAQKTMAIITLGLFTANLIPTPHVPLWVIATCAIVMALGTCFGGLRIVETVGFKISKLQPSEGFAAETTASLSILTASFLGFPLSSTHLIVGSIAGVGAAGGSFVAKGSLAKKISLAWVLTLPGSALISYVCFLGLEYFFKIP